MLPVGCGHPSKTSKTSNLLKNYEIYKTWRKFQLQVVNWCWPTLEILVSLDKKCRSANKTLKPWCAFAFNDFNNANFDIICYEVWISYLLCDTLQGSRIKLLQDILKRDPSVWPVPYNVLTVRFFLQSCYFSKLLKMRRTNKLLLYLHMEIPLYVIQGNPNANLYMIHEEFVYRGDHTGQSPHGAMHHVLSSLWSREGLWGSGRNLTRGVSEWIWFSLILSSTFNAGNLSSKSERQGARILTIGSPLPSVSLNPLS